MPSKRRVYDFRIVLLDTSPAIWRRIQVPEGYTFWDLHVAIQDSMGWFDCHLHAFRFGKGKTALEIGIPDDEGLSDIEVLAGWKTSIKEYFEVGDSCAYEYDFGDGWTHELTLQGIVLAEGRKKYPTCVDGAQACPPEDCGGIPGYYHLLEVLTEPEHEEYEDFIAWLGGAFEPESFDPAKVRFDNPKKRLEDAFSNG